MLIRSISPQHIGPFSTATKIEIDKEITIFTGPNDSGKSCALSAIKMLCDRTKGEERHVNMDRIGKHAGPWNTDPNILISAEIEVTETSVTDKLITGRLQPGDVLNCQYPLNSPSQGYKLQRIRRGPKNVPKTGAMAIRKLPKIVEFRSESIIRSIIDLAQPTAPENHLLKLAFGAEFVPKAIQELSVHSRGIQLDRAKEALNLRLRRFFPRGMRFEFRLTDIAGEGKHIGVSLVDDVNGFSPVENRGSGVKRLLALMGLLLQEVDPNENTILLLDEPETSLHADAQHQIRRVLEEIAKITKVQVVYATHSPAMVNPAHPERLRVFSRHLNSDVATTKVETPAYGENFQRVRTSLGITPSDSLLYGLVTVLVEGDTEARCLGSLLRRLDEENIDGFEGLTRLLESCHFVCGGGDSISYYCKLAADQNASPIVFLDGDKPNIVRKLRDERPGVPVIPLPEGAEFENLVPPERYITALAASLQSHDIDTAQITIDAFNTWSEESKLHERMLFSKRINRWVEDLTGGSYNKHAVMDAAIKLTPVDELQTASLRELAQTVRMQFE